MRLDLSDASLASYVIQEVWWNTIRRVLLEGGADYAVAVAVVDSAGNVFSPFSGTSAVTSVADSAISVTLLAANTSRKGCIIFNDSTAILRIKFGATASPTSFTHRIVPQGSYEMSGPIYTGVIDGIWESDASGSARITQLT